MINYLICYFMDHDRKEHTQTIGSMDFVMGKITVSVCARCGDSKIISSETISPPVRRGLSIEPVEHL